MKKAIVLFLVIAFIFLFKRTVNAAELVSSGRLLAMENIKADTREEKLRLFLLSKNSGCVDYAGDFIKSADEYGLDWKLGPAISGIESSFCQVYPRENNNPFGIAGGYYYFESLPDSISYLNKLIATESYYTQYQKTKNLYDLAIVYCQSYDKWYWAVTKFMEDIENFSYIETSSLPINL